MKPPFQPGDKVIRIGDNTPGIPIVHSFMGHTPKYGDVHCVEYCFCAPNRPWRFQVWIVGFEKYYLRDQPCGWPATAFRKVEEARDVIAAEKETESLLTK